MCVTFDRRRSRVLSASCCSFVGSAPPTQAQFDNRREDVVEQLVRKIPHQGLQKQAEQMPAAQREAMERSCELDRKLMLQGRRSLEGQLRG